ncbi:hypothetical protein GCM10027447_39000 [Glycomyces halotolerans]
MEFAAGYGRRRLLAVAGVMVLAVAGLATASSPAQAQACTGGTDSDFDGDGSADLAIGDPDATVAGAARSGAVHIAYADGRTQSVTQRNVADNDAAAGDRFGYSLASTDWNGDGCADLFVGVPFEDWSNNTLADAGIVVFIPGSPNGLDVTSADSLGQGAFGTSAGSETGDRFGFSLAAGTQAAGLPYLVAGAPGESIGTVTDAGAVVYATPDAAVNVHQNSTGVPGSAETGDGYGYSVAASGMAFAIGAPGEAIGADDYAGAAHVFAHNHAGSVPPCIGDIQQDAPGVSGGTEVGDMMGYSLAMVDYIPPGGGSTATMVTISAPGEEPVGGEDLDSGWVFEFDIEQSASQRAAFHPDSTGVDGERDHGDFFGSTLTAVNRTPSQAVDWDDLLVAVGSPGEDIAGEGLSDRGTVQVFSLIGAPGDHDVNAMPELESAGVDRQAGTRLGSSMQATATHLFIADPWSTSPAVYGIPWDNLTAGATDPHLVYTPADFDLTDIGTGSFGASLA